MRVAAIIMLVLCCSSSGIADGISNPGTQFIGNMGEGVSNNTGSGSGPPPVGCAGTGLDFTIACNSQYISVF